jgi:hypothetical protein
MTASDARLRPGRKRQFDPRSLSRWAIIASAHRVPATAVAGTAASIAAATCSRPCRAFVDFVKAERSDYD